MAKVEFVEYTGRYPNRCSGRLFVKIDGKMISFGDYFTCSLHQDERVALVAINTSVHIIPKKRDYSTTKIIKKIRGN